MDHALSEGGLILWNLPQCAGKFHHTFSLSLTLLPTFQLASVFTFEAQNHSTQYTHDDKSSTQKRQHKQQKGRQQYVEVNKKTHPATGLRSSPDKTDQCGGCYRAQPRSVKEWSKRKVYSMTEKG
jgi:hypothetical protein